MIRVGLIGVGNCASALVQGIQYYRQKDENETQGLITPEIGGYLPGDIEVVSAFDVDPVKLALPLNKAIYAPPNNTYDVVLEIPNNGVSVTAAPLWDGMGSSYREVIERPVDGDDGDVLNVLKSTGTEILINYLPVGSEKATRKWAGLALAAGCGFINAIPVFIAKDDNFKHKFEIARLPLLGDDIKSQVGATIMHRMLVHLCKMRGFAVDETYQINFGGNMDFYNMKDRERLVTKKKSKTGAVTSLLDDADFAARTGNTHISPSDHIPFLADCKWAYIYLHGRAFAGVPFRIEVKMELWDSPNSAGVIVDAIRWAKVALDQGVGGNLDYPAAYLMKSPPFQIDEEDAVLALARGSLQLMDTIVHAAK